MVLRTLDGTRCPGGFASDRRQKKLWTEVKGIGNDVDGGVPVRDSSRVQVT